MADKHTKRELFETLLVFLAAAEADEWVVKGVEHELELVNRKRSTGGADVKRAAEQRVIMDNILMVMDASDAPMRANAIAKALDDGTAVQRVSALLKKMVEAGEVVRHEDKKVVTFTLV